MNAGKVDPGFVVNRRRIGAVVSSAMGKRLLDTCRRISARTAAREVVDLLLKDGTD
jgi:hypothetical protein